MTAPDPRVGEIESIHIEAVEAAAKATYEHANLGHPWDAATSEWKDAYRASVSAGLEAAHPVLLAELRKAHEALTRVEELVDNAPKMQTMGGWSPGIVLASEIRAAVTAANGDGRNHVPGTEWGTDHWGEVLSEPTEDHARSVARAAGANVYHRSPMGQWIKDESE